LKSDADGMAHAAPVGLFEADGDMVIRAANPAMATMTGQTSADLAGRPFRDLLTRSSQFIYALKAEPSLADTGSAEEIFLELAHADGRPRPALLTVSAEGDRRHGALFSAPERRAYELELVAARQTVLGSLDALKAANDKLEQLVADRTAALTQRDLLLREVYHRVKNNLQVVDGLLLLHSRKLSDPDAVTAIEGLRKRVYAIGLVHHQLMGSSDLKTFDVGAFLRDLVAHLQQGAPDAIALRIETAPLSVDLDFAVPLGLLVTELITNALKHAFPGGVGEVRVALEAPLEGEILLRIADNGVGFSDPTGTPTPSLGLTIVKGLVRQLRGRIRSSQENGVCWEARFPVPGAV
jgi:PAS domain S-box-containing protein